MNETSDKSHKNLKYSLASYEHVSKLQHRFREIQFVIHSETALNWLLPRYMSHKKAKIEVFQESGSK